MRTKIRNSFVAAIVALSFFASTSAGAAVQVTDVLNRGSDLRVQLNQSLDRNDFAAELQKMGVEKDEVRMRLAGMSDRELQDVAVGVERQAGGDVVVISLTAVLIGALILILLLRPWHHDTVVVK